jgi:hypothetical protein
MRVSVIFENDSKEDGFNGRVTLERQGIDDLYGLARLYGDATRAAGFTYVADVGFEKDDGKVLFGDG